MFTRDSIRFLKNLKANNDRDWFAENKKVYERDIKKPATLFAEEMAGELEALTTHEYKTKLFRIYRDVRFSKDKTPYNPYQRMSFIPQNAGPNTPAWFFSLETDHVVIGTGLFGFDKQGLDRWRERIDGPKGEALAMKLIKLEKVGVRISEPELKRVPSGYDKDHPRAQLLRHKGLAVWIDFPDATIVTDGNYKRKLISNFKRLKPVYDWLYDAA